MLKSELRSRPPLLHHADVHHARRPRRRRRARHRGEGRRGLRLDNAARLGPDCAPRASKSRAASTHAVRNGIVRDWSDPQGDVWERARPRRLLPSRAARRAGDRRLTRRTPRHPPPPEGRRTTRTTKDGRQRKAKKGYRPMWDVAMSTGPGVHESECGGGGSARRRRRAPPRSRRARRQRRSCSARRATRSCRCPSASRPATTRDASALVLAWSEQLQAALAGQASRRTRSPSSPTRSTTASRRSSCARTSRPPAPGGYHARTTTASRTMAAPAADRRRRSSRSRWPDRARRRSGGRRRCSPSSSSGGVIAEFCAVCAPACLRIPPCDSRASFARSSRRRTDARRYSSSRPRRRHSICSRNSPIDFTQKRGCAPPAARASGPPPSTRCRARRARARRRRRHAIELSIRSRRARATRGATRVARGGAAAAERRRVVVGAHPHRDALSDGHVHDRVGHQRLQGQWRGPHASSGRRRQTDRDVARVHRPTIARPLRRNRPSASRSERRPPPPASSSSRPRGTAWRRRAAPRRRATR